MIDDRLKFRVYVFGRKKTYDVVSIEYRWFNHELETIAAFLGDNEETVEYVTVDCVHNTLEQCTGLRDKNGKLIYEGDILQYTDTSGLKIQQEVVWDSENARFAHVVDWGCFDRNFSPLEREICAQKEIVGNIHEGEK